jgi:hypothetical protein
VVGLGGEAIYAQRERENLFLALESHFSPLLFSCEWFAYDKQAVAAVKDFRRRRSFVGRVHQEVLQEDRQ